MNRCKITSRLLDLARKGIRHDELDGPDGVAALQVKYPGWMDAMWAEEDPNDFRNATKKPISRLDRRIRRVVSKLRWTPTLLKGKVAPQ